MQTEDATEIAQTNRCPHCDFTYGTTKKDKPAFLAHMRTVHPDKTKKAQERKAAEDAAAKATADLSPRGELFQTTLASLGLRPGIAQSMTSTFNRNASMLTTNRDKFRSWMLRYGLTRDQMQVLEDEMFGLDDEAPTPQQPGQPTAYMPLPGGGFQPIFLNGGQQPQAAGPMVITLPGAQGSDTKEFLQVFMAQQEQSRQEFRETMSTLLAAITAPKPSEERPAQMMRVPMMGSDGKPIKDDGGQTVYMEQPYTPGAEWMQMFGMMFGTLANRNQPKEVDEEKLTYRIRDAIKADQPPAVAAIPEAVTRALEESKAQLTTLGQQMAQVQEKEKLDALLEARLGPIQAQLSEAKAMSGMSDTQFGLYHKERLQQNWQDFVKSVAAGTSEQLKPLMVGPVTTLLKQQGADADTINRMIQQWLVPNSMGAMPAGGGRFNPSKAAEMVSKWER